MRRYFGRSNSVQGVTVIRTASDIDLVEKATELFEQRGDPVSLG
jgi:hypothetical protein